MTSMAGPNRTRIGYMRIIPEGMAEKAETVASLVTDLKEEALRRLADIGLVVIGEPVAMVMEVSALWLLAPATEDELALGPGVALFVEVKLEPFHAHPGELHS